MDSAVVDEKEFEFFRSSLINVAVRITSDLEQARDIVQDTYVTLLEGKEAFKGRSSLKTYLYRIVINKCIDVRRRKTRWYGVLDTLTREFPLFSHRPDEDHDNHEFMRTAFAGIADIYRIPLILAEFEGLSYEEIADTLKVSINTVRSRIFRCREKLRKTFERVG